MLLPRLSLAARHQRIFPSPVYVSSARHVSSSTVVILRRENRRLVRRSAEFEDDDDDMERKDRVDRRCNSKFIYDKYFSFPSLRSLLDTPTTTLNRATIASQLYRLDQSPLVSTTRVVSRIRHLSISKVGRRSSSHVSRMVITRVRRVISVQKPNNVCTISLSLWIRSAIKRTSSSSVATVTLGPRSRRVDFSRQGRCCSTRSV